MRYRQDRASIARDLSMPIVACVARNDTQSPAVHGCIDWHSAVHGTWALVAYMWATSDQTYRPLIESVLQPPLLLKEREHLAADPSFEMPYGRAWFLRLAIDYRRAVGTNLLDEFGDEVAASLIAHYSRERPEPSSVAYDSATWALINLYDYGISRNRTDIVKFVQDEVHAYYMTTEPCRLQQLEVETGEFMALCTNWAWLVGKTMEKDEFARWLREFFPENFRIEPITRPSGAHQAALNFSRAWGLWSMFSKTGELRFLSLYLQHLDETYSHPELWNGSYEEVGHWVAQFGVLAVMVTYYD